MVTTARLRREFWQVFKQHMAHASAVGCSRPSSDGWMWHAADLSAGYLASLINVRLGEIGVRFRLNGAGADTVFSLLQAQRSRVDAVLDPPPTWRPGEGSSHVIEVSTSADISLRNEWPAQMTWLCTHLESFQVALWPLVGRVPPAGARRPWDEELFFRELTAWNPACLAPAAAVIERARRRGEVIKWGSGGQVGSCTPSVLRRGIAHQLVSVRTDGTFQLLFTHLRETPPFVDRSRRLELLQRVNQIRHLRLPEATVDQRPAVPLAVLTDGEAGEQFAGLLDWFHDSVTRGG